MQMPILKKDSEVWKLAIKYCRRKYTISKPIQLLADNKVKFKGLVYGNEWVYTKQEIEILLKGNKRQRVNALHVNCRQQLKG